MRRSLDLYAKIGRGSLYLLDASSLINIIKRSKLAILASAGTLDLALYESLNVIWSSGKRCTYLRGLKLKQV